MSNATRPDTTPEEIEAAVRRICSSAPFASSERLKAFLRFIVRETLAGRADTLKEYTVGVVVYERGNAFNPKVDSIVRTEARRLRARLEAYYQDTGLHDPLRIDLARGTYVPVVRRLNACDDDPRAERPAADETPGPPPHAPPAPIAEHATARSSAPPPSRWSGATRGVLGTTMILLTLGAVAWLVPAAQAPPPLTFEEVDLSEPVPTGGVSRDGRYLVAHDAHADAWRLDLQSSQTEKLTFGPEAWDSQRVPWMLPSPDGGRIAYTWMSPPNRMELRLMTPPAGMPRSLRTEPDRHTVRPVAWSGDGRQLLVVASSPDGGCSLQLVAVETGATSTLAHLGPVAPLGVTMTDDATWIAYDHAPRPGPRDIMLLDVRTGRARPVVRRPADDVMPLFVDGGRALVFASQGRRGSLWRQALVGGEPEAGPQQLRDDVGRLWALGATRTGMLVYGVQQAASEVHVAALDSAGHVSTQPSRLGASSVGAQSSPAWSPDGRALVYVQQRAIIAVEPGVETLVRRDWTSGAERSLPTRLSSVAEPRWSPDGTRLLVRGRAFGQRSRGLHVLDARTGAILQSLPERTPAQGQVTGFAWARSADAIVAGVVGRGLVHIDLSTGVERVLVPLSAGDGVIAPGGVAATRDGRRIAYLMRAVADGPPVASLRVYEDGRGSTEQLRVEAPDWLLMSTWTSDARALLVARQFRGRPGASPERREVWRLTPGVAEPESIGLASTLLREVTLHPAGTAVAYVDGAPSWVLRTLVLPANEHSRP